MCQIFKAQVEQSTFMKIANKEVGWTFSDQEEAAIIDGAYLYDAVVDFVA